MGSPRGRLDRARQLVASWGNVQFEKGFQVLARSINIARGRLPHIRGVIAGRRSYLPDLQSQVDVEGVSDIVDLPGFVNDDQLRAIAHRAGVVVIPSLYEPFGIVALEALAAGAPLVAARTGGLAELLADTDAGLMFEPGNPEDLARCIISILTDDELAARLTTNGRRWSSRPTRWTRSRRRRPRSTTGCSPARSAENRYPRGRCAPSMSSPSSAVSLRRSSRWSDSRPTSTGRGTVA